MSFGLMQISVLNLGMISTGPDFEEAPSRPDSVTPLALSEDILSAQGANCQLGT